MNTALVNIYRYIFSGIPESMRFRNMWWKTTIGNSINRINSLSRSRKIILLLFVGLLFIYIIIPRLFWNQAELPPVSQDPVIHIPCMTDRLLPYRWALNELDTVITNVPQGTGQKFYPPYVGNGYLAVSFDTDNGLFIRLNRALSQPVNYYPVIKFAIDGVRKEEVNLLQMKKGIATKILVFSTSSGCVTVETHLTAHRTHPSLLIQEIQIHNPTDKDVFVDFDQVRESGWTGSKTTTDGDNDNLGVTRQFTVTSGAVKIEASTSATPLYIGVSVASVSFDKQELVKAKGSYKRLVITTVHYTKPDELEKVTAQFYDLETKCKQDIAMALKTEPQDLRSQHTGLWAKIWLSGFGISTSKAAGTLNGDKVHDSLIHTTAATHTTALLYKHDSRAWCKTIIWQSGFGISMSKAAGALNGDKINSTMYYVLSNTPAPLNDPKTSKEKALELSKTLHYPDKCYNGHTSLHSNTLWQDAEDEDSVSRIVTTWIITLEKQGCHRMIEAGVEGVLQAMILSIGALHFGNDHLEMRLHPEDTHRDLKFHRLNYGNNTHLNISLLVGEDNKANIFVALDRNDKPYYACDAGCLDPPIPLSKSWSKFPVKLTEPLTAVLYITADKVHMEEYKHAIHVKEIAEAPAHEHHVIALHRHGHHFGGLPTIFWVSIAFLIIVFHLFLFKLIYNEYCQAQERFTKVRYHV